MTYRSLSYDSDIHGHHLDTYGQTVELTEQEFREAIAGHAPLLPESDFAAIGFTSAELAAGSTLGGLADAPPSFHAKHALALTRVREIAANDFTQEATA